jgi:hypothetical protein
MRQSVYILYAWDMELHLVHDDLTDESNEA